MNFQDVKAFLPIGTLLVYYSTNTNRFYDSDLILSWCETNETAEILTSNEKIRTFGYLSVHRSILWPNTQIVLPPSTTEE